MAERPRVYKTEAVVLRRRNIGEADSIFTVYSDELGKFDAVARGVRKARSHMRGHLEPLTRTRLLLARGRSLDVFTQAETVTPYRALREDLELSASALYCAELVDRFAAEHVPHDGLYALLIEAFDALESRAAPQLLRAFELQLLSMMGYELQLDACAICASRLPEEETLLSAVAGGFACVGCREEVAGGRILSVRAMKVLRYGRNVDLASFAAVRLDEGLATELQGALAEVIRYVLDREPNLPRYMDDVIRVSREREPNPAAAVQSETHS
jgi:DNA repair protein RecO (recombination protein O)